MIYNVCDSKVPESRQCLALAQRVYTQIEAHMLAVKCMIRQGRVNQALEYAQQKAHFHYQDYLQVLQECPSIQLSHALSVQRSRNGRTMLPLGVIVRTLLELDQADIGLHLLQDLHRNHSGGMRTISIAADKIFSRQIHVSLLYWFLAQLTCQYS